MYEDVRDYCLSYNLKVAPDYGMELRERFAGIRPGYHMNKRYWISVDFNGDVPDRLQEQLIYHSYSKRLGLRLTFKFFQAETGMIYRHLLNKHYVCPLPFFLTW